MRALAALLLASSLLLAACGDDDDDGNGAATATESATEATEEGPAGELTERGIGSVEVGASTEQVKSAFGPPDAEREEVGCELAGPNAPKVLRWNWDLDDGAVRLEFDAPAQTLISYRVSTPSLPTANGVRVGDTYELLRQSYGPALKDLQLGAPATERVGLWYLGKLGKRWQLFDVAGGKVKTIQGGDIQICE